MLLLLLTLFKLFPCPGCKLDEFWNWASCHKMGSRKSYVCYRIIWAIILDSWFVETGSLCWKEVKFPKLNTPIISTASVQGGTFVLLPEVCLRVLEAVIQGAVRHLLLDVCITKLNLLTSERPYIMSSRETMLDEASKCNSKWYFMIWWCMYSWLGIELLRRTFNVYSSSFIVCNTYFIDINACICWSWISWHSLFCDIGLLKLANLT